MNNLNMPAALLQLFLMTRPAIVPSASVAPPTRIQEFVHYLTSFAPDKPGQLKPRKPIDPEVFLRYASSQGITFTDVNVKGQERVSPDDLRKQLKAGRGQAFRYVVDLAATMSRFPRDAPFPAEKRGDIWQVSIEPRYKLTFATEASQLKLQTIDYLDPDGD